ncbi:hypothetical protein BC830DRAFT_1095678 [Chytriomyces sp. MP71]|nr:hypothetical protein BC830DRAFT_1095678 [Chytriomyces sp. MP71]
MSTWSSFTTFANGLANTVAKAASTVEDSARKAAADLQMEHAKTVEHKRESGDTGEEQKLVDVKVVRAAVANVANAVPDTAKEALAGVRLPAALQFGRTEAPSAPPVPHNAAAVALPWDIVSGEVAEGLRASIMALSQDKRNVLVNPPDATEFVFEMSVCLPTALAILKLDPQLEKLRFELVPKQIKDSTFWRNYFYRVTTLQQSILLKHPDLQGSSSLLPSQDQHKVLNLQPQGVKDQSAVDVINGVTNLSIENVAAAVSAEEMKISSNNVVIPDSLEDAAALAEDEYVSTESFSADWEKELQDELDEA